ncbi:alpha/beta hydrolase [Streptomyces broussonetiae]|uniref:Alpha/beta hydrolase n=1 Tax=Streptomyces broussonetiae TaxID=2686304 RepID=A0A6I6MQ37_9ACTN|nr:alpha/beta hydrolase [Streptomyces broussonetiae]QHA02588.1 alpha/beta hydrolase [Streptomyces broussonetiae]
MRASTRPRTHHTPRTRVRAALTILATLTSVALTTVPAPAAQADTAAGTHLTGTLSDGAAWIADVPARWNGTLLLFSHGFGPTVARDAPSDDVRTELLAEGYAMAGSSYDPRGSMWALNSAERDQFATLDAVTARIGAPRRTLAVGQSMGGLVNAQIARDGAGRIDGALGLCGLVAGGTDLDNYQLDAEYALARLLVPGKGIDLVRFGSADDAAATAEQLTDAVTAAQSTPQGRARIALAAAFLNLPAWAPGKDRPAPTDWADQEDQQYAWFAQGILAFVEGGRYAVEQSVGGNNSWNQGVDYARLLAGSVHAPQVRALYRAAGLEQAYVERQGHCTFTTAETVAALHALEHRVTGGHWDDAATPAALQKSATALGLDGAAYVPYRPARLTVGRDRPAHPTHH